MVDEYMLAVARYRGIKTVQIPLWSMNTKVDMQVLVRWMVGKLLKEDRLLGGGDAIEGR